jgi:uncharacterized membrane protein YgaE (UPF0421/DUF939 family)
MAKKQPVRMDRFVSDIFRNHIQAKIHFDSKANWLVGISGLIMGLTLPELKGGLGLENLGFLIIFVAAFSSFLLSLVIFEPPNFLRRIKGNKQSLMYYKSFKNMSQEQYIRALKKIKTSEQIIDQYAIDITNLAHKCVEVKNRLIKYPTYILFFGILVGALIVLFLT